MVFSSWPLMHPSFQDKGFSSTYPYALSEIYGQKSSDNQSAELRATLRHYGIQDKDEYFVADNASENYSTVRAMCKYVHPDDKPKSYQIRCLGHLINFVAETTLGASGLSDMEKELEMVSSTEKTESGDRCDWQASKYQYVQ